MSNLEILSLIITIVCLLSFSIVFTILFRHYFLSSLEKINEGKNDIDLIDTALIEEKEKKSKKKRGLVLAGKITSWTLLAIVIAGFGFSLYARATGNVMMFGNNALIVIASGSMETKNPVNTYLQENDLNNQIATYDIIQISKYSSEDSVKLYDVVAFKNLNGVTIVHRIINVSVDTATGKERYITRGDSNNTSDNGSQYENYLYYDDLIGYYTNFRIPVLGAFVVFLQSNAGIITIIALIYCLIMFDYYQTKHEKAVVKRTNMLIELLDYDLSLENNPEVLALYNEKLIYKGQQYVFEKGHFVNKSEVNNEELIKNTEKELVVIKSQDNESQIQIKNTNTNDTTRVDCKEEDSQEVMNNELKKKAVKAKDDETNHQEVKK